MDKNDLKIFYSNMERITRILGDQSKYPLNTETLSRGNARRSLVAACDIPKGTKINKDHLTWKRPSYGISPRDISSVIGRVTTQSIDEDCVLEWKMVR